MEPETWSKVKEILDTCLDLEPALCSRYLDEACAGDPEIRTEVESLLAVARDPDASV